MQWHWRCVYAVKSWRERERGGEERGVDRPERRCLRGGVYCSKCRHLSILKYCLTPLGIRRHRLPPLTQLTVRVPPPSFTGWPRLLVVLDCKLYVHTLYIFYEAMCQGMIWKKRDWTSLGRGGVWGECEFSVETDGSHFNAGQWMIMNDNEWQWMTMKDNEWQYILFPYTASTEAKKKKPFNKIQLYTEFTKVTETTSDNNFR